MGQAHQDETMGASAVEVYESDLLAISLSPGEGYRGISCRCGVKGSNGAPLQAELSANGNSGIAGV
jgi:hypothetical protein